MNKNNGKVMVEEIAEFMIREAREWLMEIFPDEIESIQSADKNTICKAINATWEGGLKAFAADMVREYTALEHIRNSRFPLPSIEWMRTLLN